VAASLLIIFVISSWDKRIAWSILYVIVSDIVSIVNRTVVFYHWSKMITFQICFLYQKWKACVWMGEKRSLEMNVVLLLFKVYMLSRVKWPFNHLMISNNSCLFNRLDENMTKRRNSDKVTQITVYCSHVHRFWGRFPLFDLFKISKKYLLLMLHVSFFFFFFFTCTIIWDVA
jgi:hypothetical protein